MTEERVAELSEIGRRGRAIVKAIENTKTLIDVISSGGDVDFVMVITGNGSEALESISKKARDSLRLTTLDGLEAKLKLLERELKNLSE